MNVRSSCSRLCVGWSQEKHWSFRRCGGISKQLVTCCCESIDWVRWGEAESSAASRRAFRSVNRRPVLPIWRKNEAPAAPQFPLAAGRSRSRLQPSRLQHAHVYSARLFSGSLIVFNDASQLSRDLFYEAEWDVGWSALLARAALQSFQLCNFISLRNFSAFLHCTDPLEQHGSKSTAQGHLNTTLLLQF